MALKILRLHMFPSGVWKSLSSKPQVSNMVANNTKLSEKLRTWRTSALQLRKHALELEVRQFICPPSTFQSDAVQVVLREDFDFSCPPMPIILKSDQNRRTVPVLGEKISSRMLNRFSRIQDCRLRESKRQSILQVTNLGCPFGFYLTITASHLSHFTGRSGCLFTWWAAGFNRFVH